MIPDHLKPFKGTVEELLSHVNESYNVLSNDNVEDVRLTDAEHISLIMIECNLSLEDATTIFNSIKEEYVQDTIDEMIEDGLLEISSYTELGEPKYRPTELGKLLAEEAKKRDE